MSKATNPFADVRINRFSSSFDSTPVQTLTLAQALDDIRTGRDKAAVLKVRQILARRGKSAYDKAKSHLPAYTFAGTFAPSRANAHFHQHSGILHGDMDHLSDVQAIKHAICHDPRIVYCFVSPSETGLKPGVSISGVDNAATYRHAWQMVAAEFERRYGARWDPSGKDVSRLSYTSFDPDAYFNPDAIIFEVPPAPTSQPRTLAAPRLSIPRTSDHRWYADQAIQTAVDMIQTAELGTRHHSRLRASRLLGGYVAGGLLNEEEAYGALAQALVGHTEDLARALKTVEDGLKYGKAHPITLDPLEAEREEWSRQYRNSHPRRQGMPPDDPWDGTNTLRLKPYVGYRGLWACRHGRRGSRGHSS